MYKYLICITLCLLFICCNKNSNELSKADSFVSLLKEDANDRIEVPDFTSDEIAELLAYRNDEQNISNFPRNPLSSFYLDEVTIGMYALWTIEAIRLEAINSPDFYLYASLNPRVVKPSTGEVVNQDEALPEVASAYINWWASSLTLEEKLRTNPLEGLDLAWN